MAPTSAAVPVGALVPTYATYPFEIVRGEGMLVYDAGGRAYLDFYGGHAVASLGHSPTALREALNAQSGELLFYSNVARMPLRDRAAAALVAYAGAPNSQVFFCNSGTEANEAALKVAMQQTGRTKLAALEGGFHGRTLLSLSATHGASYRKGMEERLVPCLHLKSNHAGDLERLTPDIAAMIVEPVQSMAGVVKLDAGYLTALRARTRELGIQLVFDEVQTGVGRVGESFAARSFGVIPDSITTAKGLGGGVPVGAAIFSEAVASKIQEGDLGSTFGGGPLACAAVLAVLAQLEKEQIHARVRHVSAYARSVLRTGPVTGIRGEGWLMGLETAVPAKDVHKQLLEKGILTGTSGNPNVLRLLPPLIAGEQHVESLRVALESL